jgi:hypothetical protein
MGPSESTLTPGKSRTAAAVPPASIAAARALSDLPCLDAARGSFDVPARDPSIVVVRQREESPP